MATSTTFRLDMTRMYLMHDALRRELERLARVTARADGDPKQIMRTAVGWELLAGCVRGRQNARGDR